MTGIDTNILVRYLTADDPAQYKQALQLLESSPLVYISPIVWVETVWVLTHFYGISRKRQCDKLIELLDIETFRVDSSTAIANAIKSYRKGYDFADAMIGQHNALQCETTWTFDKKAARLPEFTRLK
ncbi:type II toxin-antitoxin system VapC family toxin [Endozoicomonas gorgoniicola]|uniref:Type II toxin-antitoxin system VapC family toxin n=1 Tax=Endozoicomonas gorgoniicola TaxID=1234144 RepID=A0ABT3MUY5_9GAMM|nr:type II toxin-antitoxin system VapC family toxin [Endozoicomonas gorgoniicola]MCW7553196.1 type II toxin-antitoxin system VapC family toxin [Endozoicomonas gorgoniicola]